MLIPKHWATTLLSPAYQVHQEVDAWVRAAIRCGAPLNHRQCWRSILRNSEWRHSVAPIGVIMVNAISHDHFWKMFEAVCKRYDRRPLPRYKRTAATTAGGLASNIGGLEPPPTSPGMEL